MDILQRIDLLISDQIASGATTTGNVEPNTAKRHIDIVGGKCPDGQVYSKEKKVCVPKSDEAIVTGAVAGSGQTRVWGERRRWMVDLDRKEPVEIKFFDKAKENIEGRKGLKFDHILGAYIPKRDTHIEGEA